MNNPAELHLDTSSVFTALAQQGVKLNGMSVPEEVGSTNSELVKHVTTLQANSFFFSGGEPEQWAAPSLLATTNQTGGKGRAGRTWQTPPHTSLTFSLHLEVDVPQETVTWLPLLVGTAVASVLQEVTGVKALVKWPNDIVVLTEYEPIDGWLGLRKLGGVLVERVGARSVVVGVGLNVSQNVEQLAVPTATSLQLEGALDLNGPELLAQLVSGILRAVSRWEKASGDVASSGDLEAIEALSTTLGADVQVDLADGTAVKGKIAAFGQGGSLQLTDSQGETHAILVGDVNHLRLR